MNRRVLPVLATLPLLLGGLAFTAPAALAQATYCTDEWINHYHDGNTWSPADSLRATGIQATINPPTVAHFRPCSLVFDQWFHDGATAYVSIEAPSKPGSILQIGITNCNEFIPSYCAAQDPFNQIHAFWAVGGCGFNEVHDIGPVNDQQHWFEIRRLWSSYAGQWAWSMYFDYGYIGSIFENDSRISCFLNGSTDTMAAWMGELWDGGDSFGSKINGNQSLLFNYMRYMSNASCSGCWAAANWNPDTNCFPGEEKPADNSDHLCNRTTYDNGNSFEIWSVPH